MQKKVSRKQGEGVGGRTKYLYAAYVYKGMRGRQKKELYICMYI